MPNYVKSTYIHGTQITLNHEDIAGIFYQAGDIIKSWERIMSLPNCNYCGRDNCRFKPDWGDTVRFNCPIWKEPK